MITPVSFKNEILQYVSDSYETFRCYQSLAEDTLDETIHVIEKAGIDYQLAWGSLLGAVRDGGQIPWDYDIDIFVRVDQREKLVSALREELPDGYYVDSVEFNRDCTHYLMRIAPQGYDSTLLHVDVFFLCGATEKKKKAFAESLKRVCRLRYWKHVDVRKNTRANSAKRRVFSLLHAAASVIPDSVLDARYNSLVFRQPLQQSELIVEADRFAGSYSFPLSILETMDLRLDNGKMRRVPKCYESLLHEMYGDFRSYAPVSSRFREFMSHYKLLES